MSTILMEKSDEILRTAGCYRQCYRCPNCKVLLGTTTHDGKRCFGRSSVLKNNMLPRFCPDCGEPLSTEGLPDAEQDGCEED